MGTGLRRFIGCIGSCINYFHYLPTSFCARHLHHWSERLICISSIFIHRREVSLSANLLRFLLKSKQILLKIFRFKFIFNTSLNNRTFSNMCRKLNLAYKQYKSTGTPLKYLRDTLLDSQFILRTKLPRLKHPLPLMFYPVGLTSLATAFSLTLALL